MMDKLCIIFWICFVLTRNIMGLDLNRGVNASNQNIPENEDDFERQIETSLKNDLAIEKLSNISNQNDNNFLPPDAYEVQKILRFDGTAQNGQMRKSFVVYGLLSVAVMTTVIFISCYVKEYFKKRYRRLQINENLVDNVDDMSRSSLKRYSLVKSLENSSNNAQTPLVCPLHARPKNSFVAV